jgi:hypothetical protein
VGTLSIERAHVAAGTVGNKVFFAGGFMVTNDYTTVVFSSRVDIYDANSQTWSTAELSEARSSIGVVAVGNKILFAGGANAWNNPNGGYMDYSGWSTRIDIYDVTTNTWSTAEMPVGMVFTYNWDATATVAGDKAIFSGGVGTYIYDVISNSWTTAPISPISFARYDYASASLGNKAFIAGGVSGGRGKEVDVYDAITNTWSVHLLSEDRAHIRAASLNNKVFFAGGGYMNASSNVDIYDNATQSWSVANLSSPGTLAGAAASGQKMLFFGNGNKRVDIYDPSTGVWSIADLSERFEETALFITAGGNVYATTGNQYRSMVWRVPL